MSCLLAGLINLLAPTILLVIWHKKTGARFYPAIAAFLVCFPVFFIGNAIRSGFDHSSPIAFYIQQGLLFGVLEEGAKYLMMRYYLTSYDNRKDSVTYGIGHCAYEEFGCGLTCLGLIGTGRSAPDILLFQLFSVAEGTVSCVALTIIIFYGIQKEKAIPAMTAAVLLHATSNASIGIFIEPVAIAIHIILCAGECYVAYRCWQALKSPYEENF